MFPPDWTSDNVIAAIAIVASAVVAILTTAANLVYNYITTQQKIQARRSELVAEKSIEAYREIVEILEWFLSEYTSTEWLTEKGEAKAWELVLEGKKLHTKYSVYFPNTISSHYFFVLGLWLKIYTKKHKKDDVEELTKMMHSASNETMNLKELIQKHIGVETKEKYQRRSLPK